MLSKNVSALAPPSAPDWNASDTARPPAPVVIPNTCETGFDIIGEAAATPLAVTFIGSTTLPTVDATLPTVPAAAGNLAASVPPPVKTTDKSLNKPTGSVARVCFMFSKLPYRCL